MLINLAFPGVAQCPREVNLLSARGCYFLDLVWKMLLTCHAAGCVGHIEINTLQCIRC